MEKADIGLIGLGVMGQNLALNLANKGWKVVVWNRTVPGKEENVVEHFIANRAKGKGIIGSNELTDFVEALKTPRVILLMVQAGPAVDELTGKLFPLMEKGDILIDGGNSYYEDTERRVKELYDKGMYFVGCGISGGQSRKEYNRRQHLKSKDISRFGGIHQIPQQENTSIPRKVENTDKDLTEKFKDSLYSRDIKNSDSQYQLHRQTDPHHFPGNSFPVFTEQPGDR
jgi:hypothetical protein